MSKIIFNEATTFCSYGISEIISDNSTLHKRTPEREENLSNILNSTHQKTSQSTRHTRDTFPKEGMEEMRAFTESLIPSHWEIALSGRRARSARIAFNPLTPTFLITILTIDI